MTNTRFVRNAVVSLFTLISVAQIRAAAIQGVTVLNFYSEFVNGVDYRRATNVVNGHGLYGDIHTALTGAGSMWLSGPGSPPIGDYTNAYITFDLGATYNLGSMKVWNYNEVNQTARGIQRADIAFSTDGVSFTTNFPNTVFNRASGIFSNLSQTISFGGVSARYVSIKVLTNYGDTARVGLAEVRFADDSIPPTVNQATRSYLGTNVVVRFSESMSSSDALNPTNYHILLSGTNAATVLSASFSTYNDAVTLHTTPLASNLVYTLSVTNVRDLANVVSVTNTEINIDAQLVIWLKADAGVTSDGGGNVSQWDDQSGSGNHALAGANPMPTLVAAAVNGQPAVHFDGAAGQLLEIADNPTVNIKRDLTLYLVMSTDTTASPIHGPISKCNVNQPASFDLQIAATTGRPSLVRGNGGGSQAFASPAAGLSANQFFLVMVTMRGTNITHYLNGNFSASGTSLAAIGDAGTPVRFGVRADSATRLRGNLAEVMVFRGAVSDGDQMAIDNYLGGKYGIPIIPLAITSQPQSANRLVGETATFGVMAVAGAPNIFYQWQSNNVNIVNATNSLYTTPALTLAANGAAFRVFVRTAFGITNISTSATLTVSADNVPPSVYSATRKTGSSTDVVVVFSEAVATAGATNLSNYSMNNGVSISSAAVGTSSNQVILTTSGLTAGTIYILSVQNVQDLSSNTMSPATALILPSNMAMWVRADSGVRTNSVGGVTDLYDQSANQNHAQQYFSTNLPPLLVPNAMNGQAAVRFDGITNYLQASSSASLAITGDMTIYAVVNITDYAANRQILGKTLNNTPAPYDYYVLTGVTPVTRLYRGNGPINANFASTFAPAPGAQHTMAVTMQGTTVTHYVDGAGAGSGTLNTTIGDAGTPLRIGTRGDLAQYMYGDIGEIMIFSSALSASERTVVNNYLGLKYFPFSFALQPTNDTKLVGQTATFYVVPSQGGVVFNYQWQRYGTNLPSATNVSYTTPILTLADDQSTYRALVWGTGGPTNISDPAILTVLADTELPSVLSAGKKIWSQTEIVVLFSEAVDPATATNASNYTLDNGAAVSSATFGDASNKVVLATTITNGGVYMLTVQNVKDLFNNTMTTVQVPVGYYPTPLALWLKAETGVTASGFGEVSQWDDQSGIGNHVTQPNGPPFVPTIITNGFNGFNSIHFGPSTNYLISGAAIPSLALTGELSIYAVSRFDDFARFNAIVSKATGANPNSFDYYLLSGSGLPRLLRGNGVGANNQFVIGQVAPSIGTPHVVSVFMRGPDFPQGYTVSHFLDSLPNGTGIINTTLGDLGDPVIIGSRSDLGTAMKGDFAEILIFGSALSAADRQAMDLYLGNKYAILLGPVPKISFGLPAGGTLPLSWPTANLNYVLESTPSLTSPVWTTVPNTVVTANGTNTVSISTTNNLQFFRLHKQ